MARELLASWTEFQTGIDRVLALARHEVLVFDHDLSSLRLDAPERVERLRALACSQPPGRVRIALIDSTPFVRDHPRLLRLLSDCGHAVEIHEVADHLAALRDTMLLADSCHGLIRFERSQARSKLLIADPAEVAEPLRRFEAIWNEGGTPLGATTLGL